MNYLDENEEISLKVHKNEKIYDSICEGLLSYKIDTVKKCQMLLYIGEEPLEKGDTTFDEQGIDDTVLNIQFEKRSSVIQVLDDIIKLNPKSDDIEETKNYINSSTVFIHPEEPWHF